jgi:hypothetical protein
VGGCSSRWWLQSGVRAWQRAEVSPVWRSRRFRRSRWFRRPPSPWASSCLISRTWNSRRTLRRAARPPRASQSPGTRGDAGAQGYACARITAASRWPRLGTRRAAGQWFAAPTGRRPTGACAAGRHVCTPRAANRRAPLAFGPDGRCTVRSTRAPRTCRCLFAGERASSAGAPSSPHSAAQSTAASASVENTKERETWTYVCGAADIRRAASRPQPLPLHPPKSQQRVRRTGCPTVCESTVIFCLLHRYTQIHTYIHACMHACMQITYTCICVCVCACVCCVCVCVCARARVCMCACVGGKNNTALSQMSVCSRCLKKVSRRNMAKHLLGSACRVRGASSYIRHKRTRMGRDVTDALKGRSGRRHPTLCETPALHPENFMDNSHHADQSGSTVVKGQGGGNVGGGSSFLIASSLPVVGRVVHKHLPSSLFSATSSAATPGVGDGGGGGGQGGDGGGVGGGGGWGSENGWILRPTTSRCASCEKNKRTRAYCEARHPLTHTRVLVGLFCSLLGCIVGLFCSPLGCISTSLLLVIGCISRSLLLVIGVY